MSNSNKEESSYKSSLKATGITGLAQFFQILFKVVNTKVVGLLLGPPGVAIIGLFLSSINLINTISGLGLESSAVREIAQAVKEEDEEKISHTVKTLNRLVWITGLFGVFFFLFAGPWLSQVSFSSEKYATEFRVLGVVIFFYQIAAGQMALLHGFRRFKELALSSISGSLGVVIFALPLYWFFGEKGIVPALIFLAIFPVIVTWWLAKGVRISSHPISMEKFKQVALPMVKLGISIMFGGLAFVFSMWIIRILVQRQFGIEGVGHFQAGWGVAVYIQIIFGAMSRDYSPRLAGISNNPKSMVKLVNEQLHLALLLGTPMLLVAVMAAPWIITILYSSKFEPAIPQLQWLALGSFFKLISGPLGYVLIALRKSTVYFLIESFASAGFLILSFFLIEPFGMDGIGIAYTLNYFLYAIILMFSSRSFIGFRYDKSSLQYLLISVFGIGLAFCSFVLFYEKSLFFISIIFALGIALFYLLKLDELTGVIKSIRDRIR